MTIVAEQWEINWGWRPGDTGGVWAPVMLLPDRLGRLLEGWCPACPERLRTPCPMCPAESAIGPAGWCPKCDRHWRARGQPRNIGSDDFPVVDEGDD